MRHIDTFLHSGGSFAPILLTGQEVTSGTFGGVLVVLS
jgi:hypothetical protein